MESANASAGIPYETKKGWGGQPTLLFDHEYVSDTFELSDEVAIPSGRGCDFFQSARFSQRHQQFTTHLARLKALYMLDTKFSVAAFLQYNGLEEVYAGNVRLRFNPREGNDLYIVYNDLLNGNRKREVPHLPFSSERAVVVKYTYTFGG